MSDSTNCHQKPDAEQPVEEKSNLYLHVKLAEAIHYPECWDQAAYPTLDLAIAEVYEVFRCSECAEESKAELRALLDQEKRDAR